MDNKQFFDALNKNIEKATTDRALRSLEKIGRQYINNLSETTDSKIKRDAKKRFFHSKRLIRKMREKIKE